MDYLYHIILVSRYQSKQKVNKFDNSNIFFMYTCDFVEKDLTKIM